LVPPTFVLNPSLRAAVKGRDDDGKDGEARFLARLARKSGSRFLETRSEKSNKSKTWNGVGKVEG
jgi:hypothetical protein